MKYGYYYFDSEYLSLFIGIHILHKWKGIEIYQREKKNSVRSMIMLILFQKHVQFNGKKIKELSKVFPFLFEKEM